MSAEIKEDCSTCGGAEKVECRECEGKGIFTVTCKTCHGEPDEYETGDCPGCDNNGFEEVYCDHRKGSGEVPCPGRH